ncbi:MAG TPA: hypothetical protein ENN09_00765 [Planctomycetes bacterium]|nr:hypothetical protein [Planctomycetota bacterium]
MFEQLKKNRYSIVAVASFVVAVVGFIAGSYVKDWGERRTTKLTYKVRYFPFFHPLAEGVDASRVKGVCNLQVSNGYGNEYRDVMVSIPGIVSAVVGGEPADIQQEGAKGKITISAIGPDQKVSVFAWLSVSLDEFKDKEVRVYTTQQPGRPVADDTGETEIQSGEVGHVSASGWKSRDALYIVAIGIVVFIVGVCLWRRWPKTRQTLLDGRSMINPGWFQKIKEAENEYLASPGNTELLLRLCQECLKVEEEISISNARRQLQPDTDIANWLKYHKKLCNDSGKLSQNDKYRAYYSLGCVMFFIGEYYRYTVGDEKLAHGYYNEAEKALKAPVDGGSKNASHLLWYARCLFRGHGDAQKNRIMQLYAEGIPQKAAWGDKLERAGNSEWYLPQAWLDELKGKLNNSS